MTKQKENPLPYARDPNVDFIDHDGVVFKSDAERVYAPLPNVPDNTERRRYETPNPTPMEPPLNYQHQPSAIDLQLEQLATHRRQLAAMERAGAEETFEEADDFEVDDDFDPSTPYEEFFVRGVGSFEPGFPEVIRQINLDLQAAKASQQPPSSPPPAKPPKTGGKSVKGGEAAGETLDGPDPE